MTVAKSGEILFVKAAKDGIPNRDPLADSDARRLFGEDDGRISLSDVSIKRDVRDYVLAKYPDGGEEKANFVFAREERRGRNLLGRKSLAEEIVKRANAGSDGSLQQRLAKHAFDVRVFGIVYSVEGENFKLTGPVQLGWAHSLHPVVTRYAQGTTVIPQSDISVSDAGEERGLSQGTIWSTYTQPFAVFAVSGIINQSLAQLTGMQDTDLELMIEGLWRGTQHRQARGRGIQQPLFLLHVEYRDPFFRIGYLEDNVRLLPERDAWMNGQQPSSVQDIELDIEPLAAILRQYSPAIERIRYWQQPNLALRGELPGSRQELW